MDRRLFLKGAAGSLGALFLANSGLSLAQQATQGEAIAKNMLHPTLASNSPEPVGARLVCLYDVSGSINSTEHDVQLDVMAEAIASQDFRDALFYIGGPQSLAICVADFGTRSEMRIGWMDIRKGEEDKLQLLAHEIRQLKRRESGATYHAAALEKSVEAFEYCPWAGKRSIVDIMTDGTNNERGSSLVRIEDARETLAVTHEATINALITLDSDPNLEQWTRDNLVTGSNHMKRDGTYLDPGFVKIVATQQNDSGAIMKYHDAMKMAFRRKLILEVASLQLEDLPSIARTGAPQLSSATARAPALKPTV